MGLEKIKSVEPVSVPSSRVSDEKFGYSQARGSAAPALLVIAPEANGNVWQAVSGGHYYRFKIASHPISDTRTSLRTFEPGLYEKNSDIEKSRSETHR